MVLRVRTLEEHVKAILSVENRYYTKRELCLTDREPTPEELLEQYKRFNIIATVHQAEVEKQLDEVAFSHA